MSRGGAELGSGVSRCGKCGNWKKIKITILTFYCLIFYLNIQRQKKNPLKCFTLKWSQKRQQYFICEAGVADGPWWFYRSVVACVVLEQLTAGFYAEMNNYDPSASFCFSDLTLTFECSEPSAASEPWQTRTVFASPPVLGFRSNSVENDIHLSEGDILSSGLNITVVVLLISSHNRSRIKEEAGEQILTLTWFSETEPNLRWHERSDADTEDWVCHGIPVRGKHRRHLNKDEKKTCDNVSTPIH